MTQSVRDQWRVIGSPPGLPGAGPRIEQRVQMAVLQGEGWPAAMAARRRRERPLTRKLDDLENNKVVRDGLSQNRLPEQIAGRRKLDHPDDPGRQISAQTVYTWIDQDEHQDHWKSFLRRRGRRTNRRKKRDGIGAPIKDRPEVIEARLRVGDMELYYADPGCPYQRGTNENTNGLIRQYYPKGTDFGDISHHEVRRVENLIYNRPRAARHGGRSVL